MKIMTVLGTRPEIIRLSRVIERLDMLCQQVLVNTGQNSDPNLNEVFFRQMAVRPPDLYLNAQGGFGEQISIILRGVEEAVQREKPDRFLVLGDTNSALAAIVAKRLGVEVYHMEAGNRCYDDRVPEEVNRRLIDHCSDVLMPYTERSRQNLLREGIATQHIYVTGNPIYEVIRHYQPEIDAADVLARLNIEAGHFFLVTLHRAENVDNETRLKQFSAAIEGLHRRYGYPIIVSTHPHTRRRLEGYGISIHNREIRLLEPFGFFDFIALEKKAYCVLSDSGTVQEECSIFKIPNVTLRDVTERPETVECGSNILSGAEPDMVLGCVRTVLSRPPDWIAPAGYMEENVSQTVVKILTGFHHE